MTHDDLTTIIDEVPTKTKAELFSFSQSYFPRRCLQQQVLAPRCARPSDVFLITLSDRVILKRAREGAVHEAVQVD